MVGFLAASDLYCLNPGEMNRRVRKSKGPVRFENNGDLSDVEFSVSKLRGANLMQVGTTIYPGREWERAAMPEALGWSASGLAEAHTFADAIGSAALMIVQGGIVVDAWGDVGRKYQCHSIRKSLLSALFGIAVEAGHVNLSTTLADLAIDDIEPALTAAEKLATVADLLTSRSGIYHAASQETAEMVDRRPERGSHAPGTFWYSNNWDFNALGTIYEQQTGIKIYEAFNRYLSVPLHMQDYDITDFAYDGGAASHHATYVFSMSSRDLARLGLLYLYNGQWEGAQIVPAAWIRDSTVSHVEIRPNCGYGYLWLTGIKQGLFPHVNVKAHCYYAAGERGHYLIVLPYKNLVVVHRVNTDINEGSVTRKQMGWLLRLILAASGDVEPRGEPEPVVVARGLSTVVLPHDLAIAPPDSATPVERAAFSGRWAGLWDDVVPHILVVERIVADTAIAVFAWGIARRWGIHQGRWTRVVARFANGALQLKLPRPATVTYRLQSDGTLKATYEGVGTFGQTTMRIMNNCATVNPS